MTLECPHHGPTKPSSNAGLLVALIVLGFFTCGAAWLLTPVPVLAKLLFPTCPKCGTQLSNRST